MGGFGSGLRNGFQSVGRSTTNSFRRLEVHRLKEENVLRPGCSFTWERTDGGNDNSSIHVTIHEDRLELEYLVTFKDGKSEKITDTVFLEWTACNYGGHRPWFECPSCGRRVGILYLRRLRFKCRECHDLTYQSSQESGNALNQSTARVKRIKRKMGAKGQDASPLASTPLKPKGMHQKTYERLYNELAVAETMLTQSFNKQVERITNTKRSV